MAAGGEAGVLKSVTVTRSRLFLDFSLDLRRTPTQRVSSGQSALYIFI